MTTRATLLFVVEQGGYPLFTSELEHAGYDVVVVRSVRKALSVLKTCSPDIIVAEFYHVSQFRDRVSNLESLLARVQSGSPRTRVIVLLDREDGAYLDRVRARYAIFNALYYPLEEQSLLHSIERAAAE